METFEEIKKVENKEKGEAGEWWLKVLDIDREEQLKLRDLKWSVREMLNYIWRC